MSLRKHLYATLQPAPNFRGHRIVRPFSIDDLQYHQPLLRIRVDHDVFVGNDMCTNIAVNTFALNDDLQSEAVNAAGDSVEN